MYGTRNAISFLPAADADALMDWFLRTEAVEPREDGASVVQDMAGEEKDRNALEISFDLSNTGTKGKAFSAINIHNKPSCM